MAYEHLIRCSASLDIMKILIKTSMQCKLKPHISEWLKLHTYTHTHTRLELSLYSDNPSDGRKNYSYIVDRKVKCYGHTGKEFVCFLKI